jgi:hypothetical protein
MGATARKTKLALGAIGLLVVAAGTIAALALGGAFHSGKESRTFLETVGLQAGYESATAYQECRVKVVPNPRQLKKWWPTAVETASIVCLTEDGFSDGAMSYARFADASARQDALASVSPKGRVCRFGAAVVIEVEAPRFNEMCTAHEGRISG